MGFASYLEDINDRYYGSSPLNDWIPYLGPKPKRRDIEEAQFLFGDPLERPRRVIHAFWVYYRQEQSLTDIPNQWERHFRNVETLHSILAPIHHIHEQPDAWSVVTRIEGRLRIFFQDVEVYGALSRNVFQRVYNVSQAIDTRCKAVLREVDQFRKTARGMPLEQREMEEIRESFRQLEGVKEELGRDLKKLEQYKALIGEIQQLWDKFLKLFTVLAVQHRYRPALQQLDRFHLNEQQERYVTLDHYGGYRIQGASGSGKTIILIHRGLRLALENPNQQVRIFTINRALAELLRSTLIAINGRLLPNLHVAAFYDFLLECVCLFESREKYRLVDERSRERIAISWRDFYNHRGTDSQQNVFAAKKVRKLLRSIEGREDGNLDASRYMREEMVYIQSAYRKDERHKYLSDERQSRSIAFQPSQKEVCLSILKAWEEWLEFGHLCDIDGLTLSVADYAEYPAQIAQIRKALPTDYALVDEVQDFSTLELSLLRKLVLNPEGPNCFFLVGDLNQKVYPKHHNSRRVGFDFRGRAAILKQNFRNTRQILEAAYELPQAFPPKEDEEEGVEVINPNLSIYEGGRPVVLECTTGSQLQSVLEIVKIQRGCRVAVVSENDHFLGEVRRGAANLGFRCHELLRNEDIDLWRDQGDPLAANLVVARLEAVKGFEFDTVIACDLSQGVIPLPGTLEEEHWRQAAILYAALTRARDELIITFVGEPSRFLKAMLAHVDLHNALDEKTIHQLLGRI